MRKIFCCLIILGINLHAVRLMADEQDVQDKLEEVKIMIEREQITNIELKAELAARESEVSELRLKLKEIEEEIEKLRQQHNLS